MTQAPSDPGTLELLDLENALSREEPCMSPRHNQGDIPPAVWEAVHHNCRGYLCESCGLLAKDMLPKALLCELLTGQPGIAQCVRCGMKDISALDCRIHRIKP